MPRTCWTCVADTAAASAALPWPAPESHRRGVPWWPTTTPWWSGPVDCATGVPRKHLRLPSDKNGVWLNRIDNRINYNWFNKNQIIVWINKNMIPTYPHAKV